MHAILARSAIAFLMFASFFASAIYGSTTNDSLQAADAELNKTYEKALKAMPSDQSKTKLREAQRAWVAFRDAEIAANISLPGWSSSVVKILQTELTEARTKQLKDLTQTAKGGG